MREIWRKGERESLIILGPSHARGEKEGVEGEENTEEEGGAATPQVFSPRAGEEATRGACLSRLRGGVRCDGVFSLLWWGVWYPGGGDC